MCVYIYIYICLWPSARPRTSPWSPGPWRRMHTPGLRNDYDYDHDDNDNNNDNDDDDNNDNDKCNDKHSTNTTNDSTTTPGLR